MTEPRQGSRPPAGAAPATVPPTLSAGMWLRGTARWWVVAVALGAIIAGAIVLRFAGLDVNPGGLYPDEAAEAVDAQRILHEPGFHPVFFPDDGGREALFGYLVAGAFRLAGESTTVLRGTAAAIGVAGVLAAWLLARRFGRGAGLAGAAWAAGSLWLICVSRDGMRNILVPLCGALALWALLRWQERPSRTAAALAGALGAIATLYTYQPMKLLPLVGLAWLLWLRRVNGPAYVALRAGLGAFLVAFLAIGAPMLVVAVTDPVAWFGRSVSVTPLNPAVGAIEDPLTHVIRTLGMFVGTGDPNPRHDVAGLPLLGPLLAIPAALGFLRLWRQRREPAAALILWSLGIFLLPPLVATEGGSPHFLRALGLAAPLAVTLGLGASDLVERAAAEGGRRAGRLAVAGVASVAGALAIASGTAYLARPVADRYDAYSFPLVQLAAAARASPGSTVVASDYDAAVVRFLDTGAMPRILAPGVAAPRTAAPGVVLAVRRDDLETVIGQAAAARARPVAWDPSGRPAVWAVRP